MSKPVKRKLQMLKTNRFRRALNKVRAAYGMAPITRREFFHDDFTSGRVYLNKRTAELAVNHSGMCSLTYELLGAL